MLSLYQEFPDQPAIRDELDRDEVEFHVILADVPQKHVVHNDTSADKTQIQMMIEPGVALRVLPEGNVVTGQIAVCYPHLFHTQHGDTLWDPREIADLTPFTLYRARGSYIFNEMRQEPYVTIREVLAPLPDPEMEELAAQAKQPVILETAIGDLVLDRSFMAFRGKAEELGVPVNVDYDGPELLIAGHGNMSKKFNSAVKFINTVLSQDYLDNARRLGAEKVLRKANDWRDDVAEAEGRPTPAPLMTVDDVYARMTPTSVDIPQRGYVHVQFDDGYMFGGHPFTVKTKRDGTRTSVEMDV